MQCCWQVLAPSLGLHLPPGQQREASWAEAEAAWAPGAAPARARSGCWRSLQRKTLGMRGCRARGGKEPVGIQSWGHQQPQALHTAEALPCLFLASSAGTGFLRPGGLVASSSWLQTPDPPMGTVWPFFSAGRFSFSGSSPSAGHRRKRANRTLREQEREEMCLSHLQLQQSTSASLASGAADPQPALCRVPPAS